MFVYLIRSPLAPTVQVKKLKPDNFTPKIIKQTNDYLYVEYESPLLGVSLYHVGGQGAKEWGEGVGGRLHTRMGRVVRDGWWKRAQAPCWPIARPIFCNDAAGTHREG